MTWQILYIFMVKNALGQVSHRGLVAAENYDAAVGKLSNYYSAPAYSVSVRPKLQNGNKVMVLV